MLLWGTWIVNLNWFSSLCPSLWVMSEQRGFMRGWVQLLLLCSSLEGVSTRGTTGQGCPHLWGLHVLVTLDALKIIDTREVSRRGIQFSYLHIKMVSEGVTWGELFCPDHLITTTKSWNWDKSTQRGKWQISSYFCDDVKGYLRRDMTLSLGRMKNKLDFIPLTFMNHSFPFVCGDGFLYFSQRKAQFSLSKGKQKRMQVKIFWLFQFFQEPLSKEGTWWIHPYSCPSQVLLYLQGGMSSSGHQEEKENRNTLLLSTPL